MPIVTHFVTKEEYNQGVIVRRCAHMRKRACVCDKMEKKECDYMAVGTYENSFRTTLVCIDRYEHKVLQGKIYNPSHENGVRFDSTIEFLLQMEKLFDELNCPQSFAALRTFRPKAAEQVSSTYQDVSIKEGERATFSLRILFRQNSSWQGSLMWHEGKTEEPFRSVLELLMLMDSALSENFVT